MRNLFLILFFLWVKSLCGQTLGLYTNQVKLDVHAIYEGDSVRFELTLINQDTQSVFFAVFSSYSGVIRNEVFAIDSSLSIRVGAVSRVGGMPYHWILTLRELHPDDTVKLVTAPFLNRKSKQYFIGLDFISHDNLKLAKGLPVDSQVIPETIDGSTYVKYAFFGYNYFFVE